MLERRKQIFRPLFLLFALAIFGVVLIWVQSKSKAYRLANGSPPAFASGRSDSVQLRQAGVHRSRNLLLQPAPFNMSQRLGQRFAPDKRDHSLLVGTLSVGGEQTVARIDRQQTDEGEEVAINTNGEKGSFTWSSNQGALLSGRRASGNDRELIERLVFDSPDQFVLAQLRGASYFTVANDVRPAKAGDDDAGRRWKIVRVDEPELEAERRPLSTWRLYYLNTDTGLIDRIVSQVQGETIEAKISGWIDQRGEKVPSQIVWTRQGQIIMQYRLTDFSHSQQ